MGTAIVIMIVLSLMGSVFWIMPSQADRKRMAFRQKAMRLGIKVRIPDKGLKERLIRYEGIILGSVLYERHYGMKQKAVLSETFVLLKGESDERWEFVESRLPLSVQSIASDVLQALQSLPDNVGLVLLSPHGVSVFWSERGVEADVDVLLSVMDKLIDSSAA